MDIYEITGYQTGVANDGVNFLSPADSFQNINNGFIYRQILQSRQGFGYFTPRLIGGVRVLGIFEHILPDSSTECLAFDKIRLYRYNISTNVFDPIPFGGSMAAYTTFNILENDQYISGTSYPTADNLARFVFTGIGIQPNANNSSIFFYNGTSVLDFTNIVDNPNYSPPPGAILTKANYVIYFGERLNFVIPYYSNSPFYQGILYSGIRNTLGNGDKFNVAGSGLLQVDTAEFITGVSKLGQVIALNFERSNWTLEKTKDAFNPYFIRQVPSVIGTNAAFSAIPWSDSVKSMGKTGIIATDGRQSLRIDNKIPYFTRDQIDEVDFNLTYGGFDRINNQFYWSYKVDGSDSDTQTNCLIYNYEESTWSIYDLRFSVFGQTDLGQSLLWNQIDETTGNPSWSRWDTTLEVWNKIGIGADVQKTLAGDNQGFVYQLTEDYDDYQTNITGVTIGVNTVLNINAAAFAIGDKIAIQDVLGMTELNNFDPESQNILFKPWIVIATTLTSITIQVDSRYFTPYISGGILVKIISFSAQTIPFNPYRSIGRKCYISHVEFLIDNNGGNLTVDVSQDEEEFPFKENILCIPNKSSKKAREWITMIVDNESNFLTFTLKQESPSVQLRITSMRIHCSQGALTSG